MALFENPTLDIEAPSSWEEKSLKQVYKTKFDSGQPSSRGKFTRMRIQFKLSWHGKEGLSDASYQAIKAHFNTNQGGTFTLRSPRTNVTYIVMYGEDFINGKLSNVHVGYWDVSLILEEI